MKRFLLPFILLLLVDCTALFLIISRNSPYTPSGEISIRIVGSTLLLLLLGLSVIFGLLLYFAHGFFSKPDSSRRILRISLRRGFLLAFFVIALLIFQLVGIIQILNIILLIAVLASLELYFNSRSLLMKEPDDSSRTPGQNRSDTDKEHVG